MNEFKSYYLDRENLEKAISNFKTKYIELGIEKDPIELEKKEK